VIQGHIDWISDCVVVININLQPLELQQIHSILLISTFLPLKITSKLW
jgi:hypothetical protein